MNIHHNARLTPLGRERMVRAIVEGGQTPQAAARAAGVCPRTARKWVDRFKAEGLAGLADRSSRPQRLRQPTSPAVVDQVIALRRRRLSGQHIAKAAAAAPGGPHAPRVSSSPSLRSRRRARRAISGAVSRHVEATPSPRTPLPR